MMRDLHISSEPVVTLGVTTYRKSTPCWSLQSSLISGSISVLGLATGSVILAPVSEMVGRKPVYVISMLIFMLLIIPCGLATSLAEILVVRFFGALAGSAMIANAPGVSNTLQGYQWIGTSLEVSTTEISTV